MAAKDSKLLAVRLPEADRRRIKTLAASQGLTLGEAIVQAFEAWASQLQSAAPTPGSERGTPRRR
jgi:predicted DNA binding CopG/RHH family protein